MSYKKLTNDHKFNVILTQNTFFFRNNEFEESSEAYISSLANLLLLLKSELNTKRTTEDKRTLITEFIMDKPDGLFAILSLSSISEEFILRLFTFIRAKNDPVLNRIVNRNSFPKSNVDKEWSKTYLFKLLKTNRKMTRGFVNLLFEGISIPILRDKIPLFELKKFNLEKFDFSTESLIDSLVRHSRKGSLKARGKNDPVCLALALLDGSRIKYQANQIVPHIGRKIDIIIPDKTNPTILVESSYEVTTSSGMGDKAKTEMSVAEDIRRYYPNSTFLGLVDGVGWYARQSDLKKLVSAFDDVFTFRESELKRFIESIKDSLG